MNLRHRPQFACLGYLAIFVGCGDATPDPNARTAHRTWGRQIDDVKAEKTTAISGTDPVVTDEDLAALANLANLESIMIDRAEITDAGIAKLTGLPKLRKLHVRDLDHEHVCVGDPGLAALAALPAIEELIIASGKATTAGAASLAKATNLRLLNLDKTAIGDEGMAEIAKLENLESLRFGGQNFTDAALAHVGKIKKLRHLILLDSPITDASLAHLDNLEKLESLYIYGTKITEPGLSELAARHKKWHIHFNDQHIGGEHHD